MVGVPRGTGPHRPRARGARPMTHHDDVPDAAAEERESTPTRPAPKARRAAWARAANGSATRAWTGGCGRPPGHLGRGLRCRCAAGAEPRWRGTPAGRTRAEGRLPQPGPATRGQARQGLTPSRPRPTFPGAFGTPVPCVQPERRPSSMASDATKEAGHGRTGGTAGSSRRTRTDEAASSGPGRLRARRAADGGRPGECRRGNVRRQGRDPSSARRGTTCSTGRTATT